MRSVRVVSPVALIAAVLLLVGCGSGSSTKATSGAGTTGGSTSSPASPIVAQAKAAVAAASGSSAKWTGPTSGPKAQPNKSIVFVSESQALTPIADFSQYLGQAAKAIGWKYTVEDGAGTTSGNLAALSNAIALHPSGIVLGAVDPPTVAAELGQAAARGIKIVSWQGAVVAGPVPQYHIFDAIQIPPAAIGTINADWVITKTDGHANLVIITDPTFKNAQVKASSTEAELAKCATCKLLKVVDSPFATLSTTFAPNLSGVLEKFSGKVNSVITASDAMWDLAPPVLRRADVAPNAIQSSQSDGSLAAYQRIKTGTYEGSTVAQPIGEEAYVAIDELNRAFAGRVWSHYVIPTHLITQQNVGTDIVDGIFQPQNDFKGHYLAIWK